MTLSSSSRGAADAVRAAVALALVYTIAVLTAPGQWLDDEVFGLAQKIGVGPLGGCLPVLGRTVLPGVLVVALLVVAVPAVLRRQWAAVGAAAVVVLVSVPVSRLLREWLPRPEHGYSYVENTLPSTHVTLVVAAAVAIVLVWPTRRPRWLAPLLWVVVGLACAGNVVGYAHRPSDVVASVLLVAMVTAAAAVCARVRVRSGRDPLP